MRSDLPISALTRLAATLESGEGNWVVGGSTGLVLRGALLDRAPRDIDIYVDAKFVPVIHGLLSPFALDKPADSRTERYHSTLSHYELDGIVIELVGQFRVSALRSSYLTEVSSFLFPCGDKYEVEGRRIPVVPLGHELLFNLLRERRDRVEAVGRLIAADPAKHLPILRALIKRNRLAETFLTEVSKIAAFSLSKSETGRMEPT
ncbi:nucleotidyltransferase domain-containing protein [Cohnella lupini]|uniref:Nucleotidyltransferase AbiEii toxin of type IV toxin-antitoxin system n=1 Tax=Cohnella lupini TaxID=1294267 RepID=A0A3D9IFK7_9BACL|nr:hypothetical protein [Cohnella lupini]RED60465.1 hypothetical protein DFP95_106257 [Cohnella lupini]